MLLNVSSTPLWRRLLRARTAEFDREWDAWRKLPMEIRWEIDDYAKSGRPYRVPELRAVAVRWARAMCSHSWGSFWLRNALLQAVPSAVGGTVGLGLVSQWAYFPLSGAFFLPLPTIAQTVRTARLRRRAERILRANAPTTAAPGPESTPEASPTVLPISLAE